MLQKIIFVGLCNLYFLYRTISSIAIFSANFGRSSYSQIPPNRGKSESLVQHNVTQGHKSVPARWRLIPSNSMHEWTCTCKHLDFGFEISPNEKVATWRCHVAYKSILYDFCLITVPSYSHLVLCCVQNRCYRTLISPTLAHCWYSRRARIVT